MKPLNLDNKPCSPISSNCVVWQGPDIPCIELCTGDTVSDVVFAMATELCTILDTLKVSNYDLTCFNLQACGPQDFQALIQFLIEKICENEGLTPETKDVPTCPDCVVSVAECFVTGNQTTMQLVDYVQLIGQRICSLIDEIGLISAQITDIVNRVTILENAPEPTFTIPQVALTECNLSATITAPGSYDVDVLLGALINDSTYGYCALTNATGLPADLISAVVSQEPCITETSPSISKGVAYGTEYPTWVDNPATVADSITNIWLVLCDLYTSLLTPTTITVADTNTVDLELSAGNELTAKIQDTGWQPLIGFEWYSGSMLNTGVLPECRRIGNVIYFRGLMYVPLSDSGTISGNPIPMTKVDQYYNPGNPTSPYLTTAPATSGTGAVNTSAAGVIYWNNNQNMIPSSILSVTESIDGPTRFQYPSVMSRAVGVGPDVNGSPYSTGEGVILSSAGRLGLQSNGSFYFATLKDQEFPSFMGNTLLGNSALRYMTSNVRNGELVPQFNGAGSNIHSFPATTNNVTADAYPGDSVARTGNYYLFDCDAAEEGQLGGFYITIDNLVAHVACDSETPPRSCY
jgi:hypothetical protein